MTIDGQGFSIDPAKTRVLFGGIAGKVVSSSGSRIQVQVPANAVDDTRAGHQRRSPRDLAGIHDRQQRPSGPRCAGAVTGGEYPDRSGDAQRHRRDAAARLLRSARHAGRGRGQGRSGRRLHRRHQPDVERVHVPVRGQPDHCRTGDASADVQIGSQVRFVSRQTALAERAHKIDARDWAGNWPGRTVARGSAYSAIGLFDALETIRATPPFDVSPAPLR